MSMNLAEVHDGGDLKNMIDCAFNITSHNDTKYKLAKESLKGQIPIAFQIEGYTEARMNELKQMLELDLNIEEGVH